MLGNMNEEIYADTDFFLGYNMFQFLLQIYATYAMKG